MVLAEQLRIGFEIMVRRLIAPWHKLIVLVALAVTALAVWVMVARWNINSDLNALLPEHSPAAVAMRAVSDRVGSGSSLFVVIDSPNQQANLDFARDYTAKLRETPGIALAHYHNDKTFFEQHQLLYVDEQDLAQLYNEVRDMIRQRKKEANPLFVSLDSKKEKQKKQDAEKVRTFSQTQQKYAAKMAHQEYKEYLFSDDGYALVVIVRFVESSTNMLATNALITEVRNIATELHPEKYDAQMKIEYGGGLASRQRQYNAIISDIKLSGLFTALGLVLVLGLYFRRPRAVVVVLLPLVMGVSWTLATAFLLYGELNSITVFIFAILLGLGIDFAIHILHGFDRAREEEGLEPIEALIACGKSTGMATILGAATTFATFLVLTLADFKSLSQFGVVASLGVLLTMVATIIVLPSLILSLHGLRPLATRQRMPSVSHDEARFWARLGSERVLRRVIPVMLLLSLIGTIWASHGARRLRFEEDFYRIGTFYWPWEEKPDRDQEERVSEARIQARDAASHVHKQAEALRERIAPESYVRERQQNSTGAKYTSALQNKMGSVPTILLFDDASKAERVAHMAKEKLSEKPYVSIASLSSIYDFMPGSRAEQEARMIHIRALRELLDSEPRSLLKPEEQERFDALRQKLDVEPFTIHDLPDWTKRFFREAGPHAHAPAPGEEFAFEYVIIAAPRQHELNGPAARRFLHNMEEVAGEPEEQDYLLASQSFVYTTMLDEIQSDGLRMIMISLIVVLLLLALAFRSPLKGVLAMSPLLIGAVWTFGFSHALGIRLDFFNIIILPALIGIGVDDGIHFTMRYFELGEGSLSRVMKDVGSAVTMTSVTSLIGFGGLVVTDYKGLQSLGQLAIIGISFAWLATLVVLPSLLWAREQLMERVSLDALMGRGEPPGEE